MGLVLNKIGTLISIESLVRHSCNGLILTGNKIVQMISCIPYGFQIKQNLSREANLAVHQLHVLEIMTSQF